MQFRDKTLRTILSAPAEVLLLVLTRTKCSEILKRLNL
jgi:hypothetical protein